MTDDILDRAQQLLDGGIDCAETALIRELVDALRAEKADAEELHTWAGLMYLLDRYYPEDIFPTQPDDADRDPGPRIVSLVRYLSAARTENEQLREEAGRWQSMWRQDLENADAAMRERDEANTENARMYGFIHRLGHVHMCEHPHAAPGDTWQCPNCQRTWKAHERGPLDIRWETTR